MAARLGQRRWEWLHGLSIPGVVFLSVTALIYLFMQCRISYAVYEVLVPLKAIDYPFRMLSFIIPIGVVLTVVIAKLVI